MRLQRVVLPVVHLSYAFEELCVERDLVLEVGEHGLHLLLDLSYLGRLVGLNDGEEHAADAVEQPSALLVGQDGVLERSRVGAGHDLTDVVARLPDGLLEGRHVVGGLNLAEVGRAEGQVALGEQRVVVLRLLAAHERHHHGRCDS